MKANPANFEGWTDPNGGEWIRIKAGQYSDVVFRPADMNVDEQGKVTYKIEFFGDVIEAKAFDKMANSIVSSILYEMIDNDTPTQQ